LEIERKKCAATDRNYFPLLRLFPKNSDIKKFLKSKSFQSEKFPSVCFFEKYLFEVPFGVYVSEKGLEIRWDGSPSPERTRLSLLDLFL
jgi:hypothetical protein